MLIVSSWTEERVELLKRLWAEGRSARYIGHELGVTRNAVIGKVSRLGLTGRIKPDRPKAPRAPRPRRVRNLGKAGFALIEPQVEPDPYIPLEEIEIPIEQRRSLKQLREHHCRWPVGDPQDEDFYFCGGHAVKDLPYCKAHCRIAYMRPSARPKVSAETIRQQQRSRKATLIAEAVAA